MFKDVTLSDELLQQFFSQFGGEFESELRVNICTMGRWPSGPANLPTAPLPRLNVCVCGSVVAQLYNAE